MRRIATLATFVLIALSACGGDSEPTATFTGGACEYDGPLEFDVNSTVTFTVTNESDNTDVGFAILKFPEGTTAEEVFDEGIFNVITSPPAGLRLRSAPTQTGREYELKPTFTETGQHGINCFNLAGADTGADYVTMFTVSE
jgi:hypothetical protein